MIIDDQGSCIDQQNKPEPPNKTIAGRNPDTTRPPPSIKKQQLNSTTTSQQQKPKRDYELPPLILEVLIFLE